MMENTHTNPAEAGASQFSDVEQLFSDYDQKKEEDKPKSKEDLLSKYFTPRSDVEQFRILPPLAGRKLVEEAYFHYVPVNKADGTKGFRKVYCPKHNNAKVPKLNPDGSPVLDEQGNPVMIKQRCPLCEKAEQIKKNIDPSVRYIKKENMTPAQKEIHEKNREIYKEASKWEARKYYIVRGIDKGKPKDGVKYWRFKENWKSQGIYDKLVPALKLFYDEHRISPTDINQGSDLYIVVVDSRLPNGNTYKDVSSITARNPSKLYDDPIVVQQWLADQSTWRDVFKEATMTKVLTSEQYLERVARGTDPFWDDRDPDNKRYVFPDQADAALMAKANERTSENLDADDDDDAMASDLVQSTSNVVGSSYNVNISNVTKEDTGEFVDDTVDVGAQFAQPQTQPQTQVESTTPAPTVDTTPTADENPPMDEGDYDDLPF